MKVNLIIGAGQLGSRHLQGLLKIGGKQVIYVLDPSAASLEVAKERANEIDNNHEIIYVNTWNDLPEKFNLVIVATGANVRSKVVTQLLEGFKVDYLVLEKILFQDLEAYDKIGLLLKQTNTPTWVNHPRRMMGYYQQIKDKISETNEEATFHIAGSDWGLACSALHFIDLCAFVANSSVDTISMDWIDNFVHESKRMNCIEFTGSVTGKLKNNSKFLITSFDGEIGDITVYISTKSNRWIVQEGRAQKIVHLSKENSFNEEISSYNLEFQSVVTTRIANDIFNTGNCELPTYDEACESHIPFIKESLKKYTEITKIETNICPIT